jgi:hypothetical protein
MTNVKRIATWHSSLLINGDPMKLRLRNLSQDIWLDVALVILVLAIAGMPAHSQTLVSASDELKPLPSAPEPQKMRDPMSLKVFFAYSAIDVTLMSVDMAVSAKYISPKNSVCHELNPLYGRTPTPARYWVTGSAILAGEQFLAWKLRKHGKGWWPTPMIIDSFAHAIGAMGSPHGACRP